MRGVEDRRIVRNATTGNSLSRRSGSRRPGAILFLRKVAFCDRVSPRLSYVCLLRRIHAPPTAVPPIQRHFRATWAPKSNRTCGFGCLMAWTLPKTGRAVRLNIDTRGVLYEQRDESEIRVSARFVERQVQRMKYLRARSQPDAVLIWKITKKQFSVRSHLGCSPPPFWTRTHFSIKSDLSV